MDQGSMGDAFGIAAADFKGFHFFGEEGGEFIVDAGLDVDSVCAHAGLAAAAEFTCNGTSDCGVEVCVIEDNKGRVAAELEGELLKSVGRLFHEEFADVGASCEGNFSDLWGGCEDFTGLDGVFEGGDDVEDSRRDSCAVGEFR